MILGYTLTTFPKSHKTLMHNQSNRDLWHNCKRNKRETKTTTETNKKLHLNVSRRTLQYIFTGIFVQPLHIGHIIIGLYQAARETGQFQVPAPKAQDNKLKKYQQQPLFVSLPRDMYLSGNQARHTLVIQNDSLPTPSSAKMT